MALTYEWKLTALRKQNTDTLNNIVVGTQWKIIGTDSDGNTGIFNGATPFEAKDVNGDGFIDYQDLTEEIDYINKFISEQQTLTFKQFMEEAPANNASATPGVAGFTPDTLGVKPGKRKTVLRRGLPNVK